MTFDTYFLVLFLIVATCGVVCAVAGTLAFIVNLLTSDLKK